MLTVDAIKKSLDGPEWTVEEEETFIKAIAKASFLFMLYYLTFVVFSTGTSFP
jgi:hypothetical protein